MSWYLLAAIPVFGLLVLVHEFGHFITAKWAGIRVEEFGLGFPPRIVGIRKRDTGGWEVIWLGGGRSEEDAYVGQQNPFSGTSGGMSSGLAPVNSHTIYSLNFIPIGGFVRMPGENGDINDESGNYDPESFAAKSAGKRFIVLVAGVVMNVLLAMVLFAVAYSPAVGEHTYNAEIGTVEKNSPAAQAGLRTGDTIVSVNGQPVQYFSDVITDVQGVITTVQNPDPNARVDIHLAIRHAHDTHVQYVTVHARVHPKPNQGSMGVGPGGKVVIVSMPLWQTPIVGVQQTFSVTGQFITGIVGMITGRIAAQVEGPVGIVQVTGQVAQTVPDQGWWPILTLTAILSLNLAIVNILPFPALDGGRILLIGIEVLRGGKRLKPEREGLINLVGMALLLLLMVVITISDILHWNG